jgi:hypothetical protein
VTSPKRAVVVQFLIKPLIAIVLLGLVGCEPGSVAIPPGAHQVAVDVSAGGVLLDPQTVHSGDGYLVLNLGTTGSIEFVRGESGGLTDDQLTQLAQTGDAGQGVSDENLGLNCCGNVVKETLIPAQGKRTEAPANPGDGHDEPGQGDAANPICQALLGHVEVRGRLTLGNGDHGRVEPGGCHEGHTCTGGPGVIPLAIEVYNKTTTNATFHYSGNGISGSGSITGCPNASGNGHITDISLGAGTWMLTLSDAQTSLVTTLTVSGPVDRSTSPRNRACLDGRGHSSQARRYGAGGSGDIAAAHLGAP